VIIKIDLTRSADDYIKMHLSAESSETNKRIHEVIKEKKIMDDIKNKAKIVEDNKEKAISDIIQTIVNTGKINKKDTIEKLIDLEIVKNSSGATLKLKKCIEKYDKELSLDSDKENYLIKRIGH
jgi:hypothetical protein